MNEQRLHRVEQACVELAAAGQPITFNAIAARTGIGRATLYRNPDLRAVIEEHRRHERHAHTLSGLATEIAHLRTALEAVAANVRRHEEQLRRMRHKPPA
jgi:hypothetical protein